MQNNEHPAHKKDCRPPGQPHHQQQHVYRNHDFSAPPPPQPQPQPPGRQASCGASMAMSQMVIKTEVDAASANPHSRSLAQEARPNDIDQDDLSNAEKIAKNSAGLFFPYKCTFDDKNEMKRFHCAAQTLWSNYMYKSHLARDIAAFDDAACHVRKTCAERFPDFLKELIAACPGLTVMQQPNGTQLHRLYYGFDFEGGRNFWSVAMVDIELTENGFDVVNVYHAAFPMFRPGATRSANDLARYERELAAGVFNNNRKLFERHKADKTRSAIVKKTHHKHGTTSGHN